MKTLDHLTKELIVLCQMRSEPNEMYSSDQMDQMINEKKQEIKKHMDDFKDNTKVQFSWFMDRINKYSDRYMEAEEFLIELSFNKFYQLFGIRSRIRKFILSRKKFTE